MLTKPLIKQTASTVRMLLLHWCMRLLSRARSGLWLCMLFDGADQAKSGVEVTAAYEKERDALEAVICEAPLSERKTKPAEIKR